MASRIRIGMPRSCARWRAWFVTIRELSFICIWLPSMAAKVPPSLQGQRERRICYRVREVFLLSPDRQIRHWANHPHAKIVTCVPGRGSTAQSPRPRRLVAAMLRARQAVESRSWSHPQEPTTEEWWADVLADPRAQTRKRRESEQAVSRTCYRLADEPRDTILVACSKCDWKAAFRRDELLAAHGAACPMPSLLERLAAPSCPKIGSQWDRCGVHYVDPIERSRL